MINIKPILWFCRLPLELIFLPILLLIFLWFKYFLRIMASGASISSKFPLTFSIFSFGSTYFLGHGPMILDEMITFIDFQQKTYWLQTQVKNLIVQTKFKALPDIEILTFIPRTPHSGLGRTATVTGYSRLLR